MSMRRIVLALDVFGEKPRLKINNQHKYSTYLGGFLSLLLYLAIFVICVIYIKQHVWTNRSFQNTVERINNSGYDLETVPFNKSLFIRMVLSQNSTLDEVNNFFSVVAADSSKFSFTSCGHSMNSSLKSFCLDTKSSSPQSLQFLTKYADSPSIFLKTRVYIELEYWLPETSHFNVEKISSIKIIPLKDTTITNVVIKFQEIEVETISHFMSSDSPNNKGFFSIHHLRWNSNKNSGNDPLLTLHFDLDDTKIKYSKMREQIDLIFAKILSNSLIIFWVLKCISKLLIKNCSVLYLVNKFFRFSNNPEDNKEFLINFYNEKQILQKFRFPEVHNEMIKKQYKSLNNSSTNIEASSQQETMNMLANPLASLIPVVDSSKLNLKENYTVTKALLSSKSLKAPVRPKEKKSVTQMKETINIWKKPDSQVYLTKLFDFSIVLSFKERMGCSKTTNSIGLQNFENAKTILHNYISVESMMRLVSDVEKLKSLIMNQSQKTLFDFYYLNNYPQCGALLDIKSNFHKKEFAAFWKVKPKDEFTTFINKKLLDLFNEDVLKCFSSRE